MDQESLIIDDIQVDGLANPKQYTFLDEIGSDLDVTRRLTLHLNRLSVGDSTIYTSAIARDRSPQEILESWNLIFDSKHSKMNTPLLKLESDNFAKFGPRSIAKPWSERVDSITDYFKPKAKLPFDIYSGSKDSNRGALRPITVDAATKLLKNSTNSGLPYYTKKSKVKDRTSRRLEYLLSRRDPCILFTRTQEGGKTRNVWGYPCAETLEEMRFYKPVLKHQSSLSWRSALLGPDDVSKRITDLIVTSIESGKSIFSGDISAFDASVSPELIRAAFFYIKQLFQSDHRAGLDRICERFLTIGLVTPSGITTGYHGVPSGSTFTNEVDSIVQYLIIKTLGYSDHDFQIQGDDLVISCFDVDKLFQRYSESSLPFNSSKSVLAKDYCLYLQNLYHIDYIKNNRIGGIYSTYRALNRIVYQERWSDFEDFDLDGIDYYSIRTISILENCKHHPLFEDLVRFVYSLDKYSLRFSHKAVKKYDAMVNNSSGSEGFMNNQYSDNIRGIYGFETVKLINSFK